MLLHSAGWTEMQVTSEALVADLVAFYVLIFSLDDISF